MRRWFEDHIFRGTHERGLHPLQKVAIVGLLLLLGISLVESTLTPTQHEEAERMLSAVLPSVIVDLTNSERTAKHLGKLKRNALLDEAARLKAEHMKKYDYFAHDSPQGYTPWYWFDTVKYDYLHAGENLAVYFDESEEVIDAWMDSPLHKDNILKKEYTEIGVAVVEGKYDGYSTYFVVQLFGTPAVSTPPPAPIAVKPVARKVPVAVPTPVAVPKKATEVLGDTEVQEELVTKAPNTVVEKSIATSSLEEYPVLSSTTEMEVSEPHDTSTLVERIQIEDKTVYVADHASTSTVPSANTLDDSENAQGGGLMTNSTSTLQTLYVLLLLAVFGTLISSILFAEQKRNHVQAVYGICLIVITLALTSFHVHVALAMTTSFFSLS